MLDFKINRIIGEAYKQILTGGWYLLEASQKTNDIPTTNNVQDVQITDEVVKNAMQSLGYRAGNLEHTTIKNIMKDISRESKKNRYQEELNRWYNVYKERDLGFANRIVNIANHIFLKNNNTKGQAPAQSDSTPYTIDIDYDIKKLADKRFDVHGDLLDDIMDYLEIIFGNVAEIGYPAARKKTMEEMGNFVGIDIALAIADYINQNKAQYIKSPEENKKKSDGMRKSYQQNISTHNDVMKHQQSLNKTQQTNNQAGYSSGNVNRNNSAGKLRTGSTSFNNASTQKNNKPSSSQTNIQPTYSRNNQQRSYNNNSSKGNIRLGTTFIVDDDE